MDLLARFFSGESLFTWVSVSVLTFLLMQWFKSLSLAAAKMRRRAPFYQRSVLGLVLIRLLPLVLAAGWTLLFRYGANLMPPDTWPLVWVLSGVTPEVGFRIWQRRAQMAPGAKNSNG